jgi:hypothetical protein
MMEQDQEKKERVIHMRVPPSLDTELKERAERLGVSVSNLVRNILHHTFGLAGDVIRDSQNVTRAARGEAVPDAGPPAPSPSAAPARVLGWQTFTLGLNAICSQCNTILPRGSEAGIGVIDGAGPRPIICTACIKELTHA